MEFDKLFDMSEYDKHGAFRVLPDDRNLDAIAIAQGMQEPPHPCRFHQYMGGIKRLYDVMGTGDPALLLLSQRFLQVLRDGGFTGWKSFPVEIVGRKGERIEAYEGLVITGRCGPIDHTKEKKVRKPPPVPQGQSYDAWVGVYFDPDSWDGSDLFFPEETTFTIVIESVKTALEKAKLTNVRFKPLTECERTWPI